MNLVKAKIIGGAAKGSTAWIDKDSHLTHWNNGSYIETYKVYGVSYDKDKDKITPSDYYARIKKQFIDFIQEAPTGKAAQKTSSMLETIVNTYGDKPIFSVIDSDTGELIEDCVTFKLCKDRIKNNPNVEYNLEIVMKIMETTTVKQIKPTI